MIPLAKPDINVPDTLEEIRTSLKSGIVSQGNKVKIFEDKIKRYLGVKHAIAVNSCTSALHLSLLLLRLKPGDEVITSPLTFCSTINTILYCGATPVFVDINEYGNIDVNKIEEKITDKTRAILPIHFAGIPCEMDKIINICNNHKLHLIEDAAHAFGSSYQNKKIGRFGDCTCFSFYASKNITTGDGGLITTNIDAKAVKLKELRYFSMKNKIVDDIGYKYNMTDISASIGICQMEKIEQFYMDRRVLHKKYLELLGPRLLHKDEDEGEQIFWHLAIAFFKDRNKIKDELKKKLIETGIHFIAIHKQPFYKKLLNLKEENYPKASYFSDHCLSLPFYTSLRINQINFICTEVKNAMQQS